MKVVITPILCIYYSAVSILDITVIVLWAVFKAPCNSLRFHFENEVRHRL